MSKTDISDFENSSMMAGFLYAMKNDCTCPGCEVLRQMADKMITNIPSRKTKVNKK